MKAVFKHELSSYFTGLTGYIFGAFLLLFAGIYTMIYNLQQYMLVNFEYVLGEMSFIYLIIVPILTMRILAEERRQKTDQLLYSLPLTMTQVVLGKYFAAYTFYLLLWLPMLLYPLASEIGNVYTEMRYGIQPEGVITYMLADWVGPYLILALSGAFFVALGIMCSALTRSQIIAAILCTCLMIMYYFMGRATELWGEFPAAPVFHYMSCTEHVRSFSSGVIDTRPVVLYLSLTVFTLALTKRIVDYRRWTR
jgi:ABC-2 type transport system permease protein